MPYIFDASVPLDPIVHTQQINFHNANRIADTRPKDYCDYHEKLHAKDDRHPRLHPGLRPTTGKVRTQDFLVADADLQDGVDEFVLDARV